MPPPTATTRCFRSARDSASQPIDRVCALEGLVLLPGLHQVEMGGDAGVLEGYAGVLGVLPRTRIADHEGCGGADELGGPLSESADNVPAYPDGVPALGGVDHRCEVGAVVRGVVRLLRQAQADDRHLPGFARRGRPLRLPRPVSSRRCGRSNGIGRTPVGGRP